jgi:hypothetical protein
MLYAICSVSLISDRHRAPYIGCSTLWHRFISLSLFIRWFKKRNCEAAAMIGAVEVVWEKKMGFLKASKLFSMPR